MRLKMKLPISVTNQMLWENEQDSHPQERVCRDLIFCGPCGKLSPGESRERRNKGRKDAMGEKTQWQNRLIQHGFPKDGCRTGR